MVESHLASTRGFQAFAHVPVANLVMIFTRHVVGLTLHTLYAQLGSWRGEKGLSYWNGKKGAFTQ